MALICISEWPRLLMMVIKCFNLLEGPSYIDQDLNLWVRELEKVCAGDYGRSYFHGKQNFHFEMDLDELLVGKRLFGGKANAGVSFQIGQLRYISLHDQFILVTVHTNTFYDVTCFYCCKAGNCCSLNVASLALVA
jgi:hypothetical protein